MKKILFFFVAISFFSISMVRAQAPTTEITKAYVGVLGTTAFSLDSLHTASFPSLRAGAEANWYLNQSKSLFIQSSLMYDVNSEKNFAVPNAKLVVKTGKLETRVGYTSTPTTWFRPHPVSGEGHFEDWAHAQLPGSGLGATFAYDGKYSIGVFHRANATEGHFRADLTPNVKISGWMNDRNVSGVAMEITTEKLYTIGFVKNFNGVSQLGMMTNYRFDNGVNSYIAVGAYDKLQKLELGILKEISYDNFDGLIGVAYDHTTKSSNAYLLVYMKKK